MKHLLLLIAILVCFPLYAQKPEETNRSMTDNVMWSVREGSSGDFHYYFLDKENPVEINGKNYLLMKLIWGELQEVGYLREEGKRVYFIFSGDDEETLLFDFGLQVNETITVGNGYDSRTLTVADVDTIFVDGSWVRRLRMTEDGIHNTNYSRPTYWIEGFGSDLGPLYPYGWGEKDFDYLLYACGRGYFSTYAPAFFVETKDFSFTEGNPYWGFSQWNNATEDIQSTAFFILDDCPVVVNGKTYKAMGYSVYGYFDYKVEPTYLFGVREEEGRVYVNLEEYRDALRRTELGDADYIPYPVTDDGEMILYDFNMQEGDHFAHVSGHEDLSITKVSADIYGRKTYTVSNGVIFREGYGSGIGHKNLKSLPVAYLNPIVAKDDDFYYSNLSIYGKNGVYISYISENEELVNVTLPNITTGIQGKIVNSKLSNGKCFDLQGRKMKNEKVKSKNGGALPKGIYIVNGKKIVIK